MSDPNYQPKRAGKRVADDNKTDFPNEREVAPRNNTKRKHSKVYATLIPGVIITAIVIIIAVTFDVVITLSQFLPTKYLIVVFIFLFLLVLLVALLVSNTRRKKRFVIGTVIAVLMSAVLIYGIYALSLTMNVLDNISGNKIERTNIGFYVLTDDPAESLDDLSDYTIGIMSSNDRSAVDSSLEQLSEQIGVSPGTVEYDGITDLIDALYAGSCGAIAINDAWIDVLTDLDDYSDVEDRIRLLDTLTVEEVITYTATDSELSDAIFTLYISGIDSRSGLVAKSRSDVNILAIINTETHQIVLINTPRDYYVELSISNGQKDKLTHAGIYGVSVSMDTISMLYDIDVDYYFRVNFTGFEDIVDALGGISVYSDYAFTASNGGYTYVKGYNTLNGKQALGFVRERYAFSSGDIQRGKNQMAVIKAILEKATSPSILTSYTSLLSTLSGSFETSMSYDLIASLVNNQLSSDESWNIVSYTVTGTGSKQIPYSMSQYAYVMIPDESSIETAKELIAQVYAGETVVEPE